MSGQLETARALVGHARALVRRSNAATVGLWPRAAAILGRQALELSVREALAQRLPGTEDCSARAQLLCLPACTDAELAGDAAYLYSALSRACHHHAYELPPTAEELEALLDGAERVTAAVGARAAGAGRA